MRNYWKYFVAERWNVVFAGLVLGLLLGWPLVNTGAERMTDLAPTAEARQRVEELERAFWRCDLAASTGAVDPIQAAVCSAVTEELRKRKFGGDFERMLQWWQESRLAGYQKLEVEAGRTNEV
jgi:hypothetical protein